MTTGALFDAAVLLHLVLFVYWLGGDLGVFYASRFVLRPDLPPAARAVAARIMVVVDMAPRICLVLILPSGVTLMALSPYGTAFAGRPLAAVWVFGLAWLAVVVLDHRRGDTPLGRRLRDADLAVRFALVAGLLGVSVYTLVDPTPFGAQTNPRWLAGKVAAYALCILCGVLIRRRLRPFGPAFGRLVASGPSADVERAIRTSVQGCLPFVWAIWTLVLIAAALGVAKPGSTVVQW